MKQQGQNLILNAAVLADAAVGTAGIKTRYNQRGFPFLCYITSMKKEEKIMKTKKVVVGAVAAAMLSLSVCSIAPAVAAGETVQISVSTAEAKAGEQFTVNVSLADIPSTGIQATDFSIAYDNTLITIDSVKAGAITSTKAEGSDATGGEAPIFDSTIINEEGCVNLIWTTALEDSSYWISKGGVFCTITGTVSKSAPEGTVADLKLVPGNRETYPGSGVMVDKIACGYFDGTSRVSYEVKAANGKVVVPSSQPQPKGKRGDANCDGDVRLNDAILVLQAIGNPDAYGVNGSDETHITAQGMINGDVAGGPDDKGGDGLTTADAVRIQAYIISLVTEL